MFKRVAVGLMVTQFFASLPSAAQTVPQGVFTPEMQHRPSNQTLQSEFDNRKLRSQMSDSEKAYAGALSIAGCLARRGSVKAGGFLGGALMGDPDYKRISDVLKSRYSNCAATEEKATASAISGALAEQLLVKEAPALEDRAAGVSETAAHAFFGDLNGVVTYDNIAACLAVYSPGLVYKLIRTAVGSDEEKAALQTLYQQTPECRMTAPPAQIDAVVQRGTLATALYKWKHQST